jgi:acetyl esterase
MANVSFEYPVEEIVYKTVDERQLKLYAFKPHTPETDRPAILFFHGGSFASTGGSVSQFQHHAKYFSEHGFVTLCVDCRNGSDLNFSPMDAITDARDAYNWVKAYGRQLHVDPDRIILCGASSGGYTVLCSMMIEAYTGGINSEQPCALVIFNAGVDGVEITNRLFPHFNDQAVARLSPLHHVRAGLPPMLWFVGTSDVIYDDNKRFYELWTSSGNTCEFVDFEGLEHGFFNYGRHDNVPYYDTLKRMHNFLESILTSRSEN